MLGDIERLKAQAKVKSKALYRGWAYSALSPEFAEFVEAGGVAFPASVGTEDQGISSTASSTLKPPLVYSRTPVSTSSALPLVGPQDSGGFPALPDQVNAEPSSSLTVGQPSNVKYSIGESVAQTAPEDEQTAEGEQYVMPGIELIIERGRFSERMKERLRGHAAPFEGVPSI